MSALCNRHVYVWVGNCFWRHYFINFYSFFVRMVNLILKCEAHRLASRRAHSTSWPNEIGSRWIPTRRRWCFVVCLHICASGGNAYKTHGASRKLYHFSGSISDVRLYPKTKCCYTFSFDFHFWAGSSQGKKPRRQHSKVIEVQRVFCFVHCVLKVNLPFYRDAHFSCRAAYFFAFKIQTNIFVEKIRSTRTSRTNKSR